MKQEEEAPSKKLPPKRLSSNNGAATKPPNDEILSSLLRINNFDSISSIKDESLDIDLSACVTISSDAGAAIINCNSLSCTDFWRVLDESAQNPQLDLQVINGEEEEHITKLDLENNILPSYAIKCLSPAKNNSGNSCSKEKNSFSETFLRPEPPPNLLVSPLKKIIKGLPAEQTKQRKLKIPIASFMEERKRDTVHLIKEEPREPISKNTDNDSKLISSPNFSLFKMPTPEASADKSNGTDNNALPFGPPHTIYKCLNCEGLELQDLQDLNNHELNGHRILYKCSACDREFEAEAALKKHLKTHRSVESRKDVFKKCPECGKWLKIGSMWMHRKIHSDNKKYGCDICGQKFVQKINLTHHSRVHTSEKPYECPECQKRFQERSHLQRHQKYHAQTRSYRCEKCGKMYKTERCLKVHNLVHLEQRPFACTVCDKSFISNSKLKQHSNIHTGERPFKCNYCPRDFTNFPNWLKHTRRRHKVDHKTGEQLENIPSYCSKKSSKTSKASKPNAEITAESTNTVTIKSELKVTPKVQTKRKKKTIPDEIGLSDQKPVEESSTLIKLVNTTIPKTAIVVAASAIAKPPKIKRDRKQLSPKQMQKFPLQPIIKEEIIESSVATTVTENKNATTNNFPDLHCLSITSAEELIMEQALEMEECGLYVAPVSNADTDTDNAISSETALHFKIKNEFNIDCIKEEEFVSLKDVADKQILCSSLESSPYSSPASVELASSSSVIQQVSTGRTELRVPINTFYMPSFSTINVSNVSNLIHTSTETLPSLVHNENPQSEQQLSQSQTHHAHLPTTTQALINHLYLPMMTLPMGQIKQNQVLPSVDTLFTSNGNFFHGKNMTQTMAQHNLS